MVLLYIIWIIKLVVAVIKILEILRNYFVNEVVRVQKEIIIEVLVTIIIVKKVIKVDNWINGVYLIKGVWVIEIELIDLNWLIFILSIIVRQVICLNVVGNDYEEIVILDRKNLEHLCKEEL